ncbi:response regulator [Hamadaea tsunoensis]|uniref:response regulator n=1 Tax=Hamadaea tsunoensis TaxID=53368 RepID=UPI0003FD04D2|nr:response regulator transcription factor [Hamadaea tsunoensis]
MTTRVLVADDQEPFRTGVAAILRVAAGIGVVDEAASGPAAVESAARHRPDVILMGVRLPGLDGIAATARIVAGHREGPAPRVLILTTHDLDEYLYAALRAGACGFLPMDTPPQRLLAAIAAVAEGDLPFAPGAVRRLVEAYVRRHTPLVVAVPDLGRLTAREIDVLTLIARGLSNTDIAGSLGVAEGTVKTHVNRLMSKLGLASRAQAVVVAYETGLVRAGGTGPGRHPYA